MDWWGICPTGPLPLPHHWRKNGLLPKPGPYDLYWVNEFNIEKKFNLCCAWIFSVQFITNFTIKTLFWEAEFFLNVFSECRKCYFRDPNFKNFLGGSGTRLTPSAVAYYPGGRARKMGPLAVLPHHWRFLKQCTGDMNSQQSSLKRTLWTIKVWKQFNVH
jgi:hypothetical protein